ncbi:uncharacterized protein LOC131234778 [Magnolia sinica]|uniref:uncharacterized protein LOC131234778 n=1 Tax=Magnolia sinica TaxID=86752 RepID=UPI002659D1DC|nr:uncharacterized protein LOC131234778 [Magnolia sinica]
MAFSSSLKLALAQLPANDTRIIKPHPVRMAAPAQVRSEAIQEPPRLTVTSRREALLCMSTSLSATALFPTGPAEARVVSLDIRENLMEKLEKLWESFGLSKPKAESGPGGEQMKPPVNQNDQPMNMLEQLKEKAGISEPKSDSTVNSEELKPPVTQNDQPMDVIEKLKDKAGLSTTKSDSNSNGEEKKLAVSQNDQPMDMFEKFKETVGISKPTGNSSSRGEEKQPSVAENGPPSVATVEAIISK